MSAASDASARRRIAASALVVLISAANLFLHIHISNLCDALYRSIGRAAYEWTTLGGIAAVSVGATAVLLRRRLARLGRPAAIAVVAVLALMTAAAQQTMLVSNVELIHFPQFALLAALVLATGLPPLRAWVVTVALGIGDEIYQFLVIYRGLPNIYLDFNDMVLNSIGAAWAVALATLTAEPRSPAPSRRALGWTAVVCIALLPALWWLDPPHHPAFGKALTGRLYHVMSAPEGLLTHLLLYWLVFRTASLNESAELGRIAQPMARAVVILLTVIAQGCALLGAGARQPDAANRELLVTMWCGPPLSELDDRRAAEIAAAGFDVIGAPCEGQVTPELNRRALDVASRHGLGVWIADRRIDACTIGVRGCNERLAEVVADFGKHPALAGYFVSDEPGTYQLLGLGALADRMRALDPDHLFYVNLLPYSAPPEAFGTDTYQAYVAAVADAVQPRILSYDHYPFLQQGDRKDFFTNLWLIRAEAARRGIPFMLIVQAMPHGPYRDPTEAELSWQVMHALAFGARGISYFAYWTPVNVPYAEKWKFRYGLVEDGKPTLHYYQAARINRAAQAMAGQLAAYRWIGVGDPEGKIGLTPPLGPFQDIAGGPITAGFFQRDDGALSVLLVNRDYEYGTDARIVLRPGMKPPAVFDAESGTWNESELQMDIPPGGGRLLRF